MVKDAVWMTQDLMIEGKKHEHVRYYSVSEMHTYLKEDGTYQDFSKEYLKRLKSEGKIQDA